MGNTITPPPPHYDPTDRLVGAMRPKAPELVTKELKPEGCGVFFREPKAPDFPVREVLRRNAVPANTAPVLPTDSEERKLIPIYSGPLSYFPLAIAALARHCKRGNDKHNPGEPLHWARDKSSDHADCIGRHLIDIDTFNPEINEYEDAVSLLWRAAAVVQLLEEKRLGKPPSRGSK